MYRRKNSAAKTLRLARRGEEGNAKPRVTIPSLELTATPPKPFRTRGWTTDMQGRVTAPRGTYVRTLAEDFGKTTWGRSPCGPSCDGEGHFCF